MTKLYVDVGFIVPLAEEFERLEQVFPRLREHVGDDHFYTEVDLGTPNLSGVAFLQTGMGKAAASLAAQRALDKFDIGILVVIGIAGGVSGDVSIGDVCFSGTIIDVLENNKISDKGAGKQKTEYDTSFFNTDSRLTFALKYIKLGSDAKKIYANWRETQGAYAGHLIPGNFIGRDNQNESITMPSIHDGHIVCGMVSKSQIYNDEIKAVNRKSLAIETESGGVFFVAQSSGTPVVSIRGICDYADKNKNKLETQTSGNARVVAADNAITFFQAQINNPQFLKYMSARKLQAIGGSVVFDAEDTIRKYIDRVSDTIHAQLNNLSPEYKGKPKGYRLPLPRIKPTEANASASPVIEKEDPVAILEAIISHRIINMRVPRTYPDNSLPWIIASEVCHIEIDGRQSLPVVISGDALRPPHGSVSQLAGVDLDALLQSGKACPVIIIDDLPTHSKPRIELLRRELDRYPDARFVIVNRDDAGAAKDTESLVVLGAVDHKVCDISFVELAVYLQRNFCMDDQEAGVLALRLSEMFSQFELSAHPSYFAAVGNETLMSLLRANQRSELLDLAVKGFLSFVVADDSSKVVLRRTTREAFLRKFVFAQTVEKRTFSKSALVEFVESFAEENDYEIEALEFLNAFQDKGIIHFSGGNAKISLPFIESYLLASEMALRPDEAEKYFDLYSPDFDFSTFDIYAELGASEKLVQKTIEALSDSIEQLRSEEETGHILLSDRIRPPIVEKRQKIKELQKRLEKAFDDVTKARPNSAEKQRLLDVASRVQTSAREAQDTAVREAGTETALALERIDAPLRIWGISTILLGSGSEQLGKEPKRALASKIVAITSTLLHEYLSCFPRVEFDSFKAEFCSDESLRDTFDVPEGEEISADLKQFVETIVDAYEFSLLGSPIRTMLGHLGSAAGQPVLWPSVSSVNSNEIMENLVARIWSAEIDAPKHRKELLRAISDLPPTPFLRLSLSAYFMTRVFWNHWETSKRLALLDAAEESLQPINGGYRLDKGQIHRLIKDQSDT